MRAAIYLHVSTLPRSIDFVDADLRRDSEQLKLLEGRKVSFLSQVALSVPIQDISS